MNGTIAGYLAAADVMTGPGWFYDNRVPWRCVPWWHGRDCSSFCNFALANAGYTGVDLCNDSFGNAWICYNTPRPDWFIAKFGPGMGTYITYEQAMTTTCWGFRGNDYGMLPDDTGDGHQETILGTGTASVGAHSHATGIGYDANGINNHQLTSFAVPPWFLPEMALGVVDPATVAALKAMGEWAQRVTLKPLRLGDRGPDVTIMIDLLRLHGFVRKGVHGDAYGKIAQKGVYTFKKTADVGNTDGKTFGGKAATTLLHL